MSFNIEGKQCKVCNAYLFEDDDVVFCPECGAPHHRECYNSLGHCALESLHGTENQYDSSKDVKEENIPEEKELQITENTGVKVRCGMCGTLYDAEEPACPECRTPNGVKFGGRYVSIDFLGGVPSDSDLGEGVTADEAKRFVMANTHRFIPKFLRMKEGKKASFNLLAFLFPCAWAFSRKMYKFGAIAGAVSVALTMLTAPFMNLLSVSLPDDVSKDYLTMSQFITENIKSFTGPALYAFAAATALMLVLKLAVGIFGDYFYRNYTVKTVKSIKENSDDINEDMHKKGGVSLLWLMVGMFITEFLPTILLSFTGI